MISIKSEREIELIKEAGKILVDTLKYLESNLHPGLKTKDIDIMCREYLKKRDAIPTELGFEGYPSSICVSVNDTVVHGIPNDYKLKNGDIVSLDLVVGYKGYQADACRTYAIGSISERRKYLLKHTEKALFEGIKQVKPGNRVGDISNAIEEYAKKHNLGIVRELCGHGIGKEMHEDPDIPNFGKKNTGVRLKEGMVLCIEPMLTSGKRFVYVEDDDWTINTEDGSDAAHFENTVLVTKDGYEILTEGLNFDE